MFDYIPDDLKAEKAWVNVWKNSKVPMQATVKKAASSGRPETWSTFGEAAWAVENGTYDGIGFVFHDTDLVGIDIDAGVDENGCWNELTCDIVSHCQSYTEQSRSGRGVHILVRGKLPFRGRNNQNGVEIYSGGRYFITTGKMMLFPTIVGNQEAIDYVVKEYFPDAIPDDNSDANGKIYTPVYKRLDDGRVQVNPTYPPVAPGCRNISMTSIAGQMRSVGWSAKEIYKELLRINHLACRPPLPVSEIETICESIGRYRR